ncbi:MAG: AAA family ATPase [Paracoccaceae bacterium]
MKKGRLIFFCGKMGAGKTTLAKSKAEEMDGVLISEDELLDKLYEGKVGSVSGYKYYSDKLKPVVVNLSQQILSKGINTVLDFPANTVRQRQWLRSISDSISANHICYYVERSDEVCINQLLKRGNPNTDTAEMFNAITQYFIVPSYDESLNIEKV